MSKSTAKSAPPPKKAVKKPAAAVRKPVAKAPVKAAQKAAATKKKAKPPTKPSRSPVKSVTKATTKPSAKAMPVAKAPSRSPAKVAPKSATAEPKPRSMPASPASPAKLVAPAPAKPMSQARTAAAAGKAAALAAAAAAAAAASAAAASAASASRFADRFAPPKPVARTVADHSLDLVKPVAKVDPKLASAWKHKSGRELSEPELLAMPEREYMNEKQLDFFRARLAALKDDLLSNAGETTEHLREDTSIVPDPADRATIEEEHALELRTRDRERKLLKKISQSLARIENGEYGYCDETGEPIGLGRLLARPTATLSLEAQQRREMKQKMFGD
jgi:DnaK suppressor protein